MRYAFFILCLLSGMAADLRAQDRQAAVLTIDGEAVTLEEFENIFRKNNRDSAITVQSLDEYMELFINFKLKVREARALGLDTVSKFITELQGYRAQLARPYLTDGEMLDELVKEAYSRKQEEIRASHILIKCDPGASPADTLVALNRIKQLRARILNGEAFDVVARESSEDPSARENGGELGYFTVFQMVYPFEQAAFSTPVGQISQPVRTRYGYHILRVEDRRPARGEILVAHIMLKEKKDESGASLSEQKIKEIAAKLKEGESFGDLAAKYSEDGSTAKKGGELPWFGTNKMVSEFEEAAFALQKDGDITEPFQTSYGWHIVKRLGYKPVPPFSEVEKEIRGKVSKDSRAEVTRASFIDKLKRAYGFQMDDAVVSALVSRADSSVFSGVLKVKKKTLKKTLCSFENQSFTAADFQKWISERRNVKTRLKPGEYVRTEAANFATEKILKYEDSRLEEKHDAFRLLMNEYRDGILLFELTDQKVWSRAVKDTAGLRNFYEQNKTRFMWPERLDATIYTCANADIASRARAMIASGTDNAEIASALNQGTQLNIEIQEGLYAREDKEILSRIPWTNGLSQNVEINGQISIVFIREVLPPSPKRFQECRGMVTSEYQNSLEQEWIAELRSRYAFAVNRQVLHSIR